MDKNIGNYFYDLQFRNEVYDSVYWVPINTLGKTRYTNDEMLAVSKLPLPEKRKSIGNLYEAIQLFQVSEFGGVLDNKDFWIDGVHWQRHKSPEEAVLSNEGCCATDTNWLSYFLKDRYDFTGSLCFGNADGNGHITSYIRQNNTYYFIDMMMCRKDSQAYFCKENATLSEWQETAWEGFLYECKEPIKMCRFYIDRFKAKGRDVPFCFYMRETDCVMATGEHKDDDGITTFFVPKCDNPRLLYIDESTGHKFEVCDLPESLNSFL